MNEHENQPIEESDTISRRTFLGAAAAVGGSATAYAAGLGPFPFQGRAAGDAAVMGSPVSTLRFLEGSEDILDPDCVVGEIYWVWANSEEGRGGRQQRFPFQINPIGNRTRWSMIAGRAVMWEARERRSLCAKGLTMK